MSEQNITSEVTGSVWKVEKSEGDQVKDGDVIMILESMKMEIAVESPCDGTIMKIFVAEQDAVDEDQLLVVISN